jgi:hypothetical protein
MRTFHIRTLSISTLAIFTLTGVALAQNRSAGVLNALEVRQLISHTEPGDHAGLGAHFTALADQYTAEARRHKSMAQEVVGNPSRNLTTGLATHCNRLAKLNTESAATLRQLAIHHERLAAGVPSTAKASGARFEEGAGAPTPTARDVDALAESARTAADHRALQEYFLARAKRYTADASEHVGMAQAYRGTRFGSAAVHCDRLATLLRDAATEATNAAAKHNELAGVGR